MQSASPERNAGKGEVGNPSKAVEKHSMNSDISFVIQKTFCEPCFEVVLTSSMGSGDVFGPSHRRLWHKPTTKLQVKAHPQIFNASLLLFGIALADNTENFQKL